MSKLLEYIKLLPLGVANIEAIAEGLINNVKLENGSLDQDKVEEIARRRLICSQCPFMSGNAQKIMDFKTSRTEDFCTLCYCPIKGKTAALSEICGAEYYNKKHPEKPAIDVKWFPYDNENKQRGPDKTTPETGM